MPALSGLMMFFWQAADEGTAHDLHLMMIFVGIISIILLLVFLTFVAGGIYAAGMVKKLETKMHQLEAQANGILRDVTAKATPIVDKTHAIIEDLQPKIKSVSTDVESISKTVRAKVEQVGQTVSQVSDTVADLNGKTRQQAARVDGIVTTALNTTHDVSRKVQQGIRYPVDQIAGLLAGLKTGLETLAKRSPLGKSKNAPNPYDL